jgi:HD-GYP domain-containing protein (c-di-GMP phosphodiesterase class II)
MMFKQWSQSRNNRFRLGLIMAYFATWLSLNILGLQCKFLSRIPPVSREVWMLLHISAMILVIIVLIEILGTFFFCRNNIASYTLYLGPVLLVGNILSNQDLKIISSIHEQPDLFPFVFESNFWFWLCSRYFIILGLLVSVVIFSKKLKFKKINPIKSLAIVFVSAVTLGTAFFYLTKLLSPQLKNCIFIFNNNMVTLGPIILMILVAGFIHHYSFEKDLLIYDAGTIESGKRAFLNSIHLSIFSELFFGLGGSSSNNWAFLIGYFSKLTAFCFLNISFWKLLMSRSLLQINLKVKSLMEAIEAHENFTGGHSKRVAAFARIIGKWYGMSRTNLERLGLAGTLHDAGKLSVSREILQKKEPLSESEWTILRRHPQEGAKLIAPLKLNWCEQAILQHHERPDGNGYPKRLSGTESIDLFARIIAVADTFDAITSDRHYRFADNFVQAREIILQESGKQFDPRCVNAFMKAFPELIEFRSNKLKFF